jgi:hypothetical protein
MKNYMRLLLGIWCVLMLLYATEIYAQTQIQTEFPLKRGWLYIDNAAKALAFDTIANLEHQNMPTGYVDVDEYRVVIYGAGALYVYKEGVNTAKKPVYPDPKRGGWPAELLAYSRNKLLIKSTTDGYIRPRIILLVEVDLKERTYRVIDKGKEIQSIHYSDDLRRISYSINGVKKAWFRE